MDLIKRERVDKAVEIIDPVSGCSELHLGYQAAAALEGGCSAGAGLGCNRKVYEEIFSGAAPRLETENTDSLGLVTPAAAAGAAANDV